MQDTALTPAGILPLRSLVTPGRNCHRAEHEEMLIGRVERERRREAAGRTWWGRTKTSAVAPSTALTMSGSARTLDGRSIPGLGRPRASRSR